MQVTNIAILLVLLFNPLLADAGDINQELIEGARKTETARVRLSQVNKVYIEQMPEELDKHIATAMAEKFKGKLQPVTTLEDADAILGVIGDYGPVVLYDNTKTHILWADEDDISSTRIWRDTGRLAPLMERLAKDIKKERKGKYILPESYRQYAALIKVYGVIEQNYADPVDSEQAVYQGAIPGMLRALDPHSSFVDAHRFRQLRDDMRGYSGVGVRLATRYSQTVVVAPFIGSSAHKAGLRPGDVIYRVEETLTQGLGGGEVDGLLRGPRGTVVKLAVLRQGLDEPIEFSITREDLPLLSVEFYLEIRPQIAYIRLVAFKEEAHEELAEALEHLGQDSLSGLILDLRGNPGGLLNEAVAVADMFLRKNQLIVSLKGRAVRERRYYATDYNNGHHYPLVVLIDRDSAAASEIVAGAIQDHDRGLIVGENSHGTGAVQTIYPLSEGTALALTTQQSYAPSGRLFHRKARTESLYGHYYREAGNEARTHRRAYKTDSGRTVSGGVGIEPDVLVPRPTLNRFQQLLRGRGVFLEFASQFLSERGSVPADFVVDASLLDHFSAFLRQQEFSFTEAEIQENHDWLSQQIKRFILVSASALPDVFRVELEADDQVQEALMLLPRAAELLVGHN